MTGPVVGNRPVAADVLERVVVTFFLTVLSAATADGLDWADWMSLSNWKTWAFAGLTAAFSLIKSLIALRIGKRSASLAPSVELEPVSRATL